MSAVVLAAISSEVAKLSRVVEPPSGALGYGTDLSLGSDLTEDMTEVSGVTLLAESLVRRFTTPRGTLPDIRGLDLRDRNYGLDVASYLNRGVTAEEIRGLAANLRGEALKDPRLTAVTVTVTPSPTGSSLAIEVQATPRGSSESFALVLSATEAGVLLEEIRTGGAR